MTSGPVWAELVGDETVAKAGGREYVLKLLDPGVYGDHLVPGYADRLRDLAMRRRARELATQLAQQANDSEHSISETIDTTVGDLVKLTRSGGALRTVREYLVDDILPELERIQSSGKPLVLTTGLPSLDHMIGGLPSTLIVLGGTPGSGKSALLATIADSVARQGKPVGVFSLEDSGDWIPWRLLSRDAEVNQFALRYHCKTDDEVRRISESANRIAQHTHLITVNDATGLTAAAISTSARQMIARHKVELILFDHLGEVAVDTPRKDRHDLDVRDTLRVLRDISKDNGIPVVVACHPRRREGLDKGEPLRLADFADSAAIERMARLAIGLSRKTGSDTIRIDTLKHTNGPAGGYIELGFVARFGLISDNGCAPVRYPEEHRR
jgi:replicative DNA helicase